MLKNEHCHLKELTFFDLLLSLTENIITKFGSKSQKNTTYDHTINDFYGLFNKIFSQNVLDKIMDDLWMIHLDFVKILKF